MNDDTADTLAKELNISMCSKCKKWKRKKKRLTDLETPNKWCLFFVLAKLHTYVQHADSYFARFLQMAGNSILKRVFESVSKHIR